MFSLNSRGAARGVPQDAYWKLGSGGHALCVVPSLDLMVWKMGGRDSQYDERNTGLPEAKPYKERTGWKQSVDQGTAALRMLEMVVAALKPGP
jgi:hypothetical protein